MNQLNQQYNPIAEKIKDSLEKNFQSLNLVHREHYCLRLWRITGEEKYLPTIIENEKIELANWKDNVQNLANKIYQKKYGRNCIEKLGPWLGSRRVKQKKYYQSHPDIKFLTNFIWQTYRLANFNLQNINLSQFSHTISYLESLPLEEIYLDRQLFSVDPAECINSLFFLKYLGVVDKTKLIKPRLRKIYLSKAKLGEDNYFSWLYALTHIVIAASDYYQHYVASEYFSWVLNYLVADFEKILFCATTDILAEVGMCFKLTQTHSGLINKCKVKVVEQSDKKFGSLIQKEETGLNALEHCITLTILLIDDLKKFYKGPNLSDIL